MVDLYIFAKEADPVVVDEKRAIGTDQPLRFVAATTGRFPLFAVLELEKLSDTARMLQETFGNPGHVAGFDTSYSLKDGGKQIRWTKQYAHIAFSRIRAKPGRALEVLAGTSVVPGYNGSAIVAGSYDVLVEYGADEFDELTGTLLNGLHVIPGSAWTETFVVTNYFYRGRRGDAES
ncbi:MAG: hypothetical protein ACJ77A_05170 [Actinomycetota bacterium]